MQRRDFMKAMMAATVTARAAMGEQAAPVKPPAPAMPAPGPVPWTRGLSAVQPLPISPLAADSIAGVETQFFSDRQLASLRHLCELMMPAGNATPGAIEAGVPEFLDFLLGVSPKDRQESYTRGLDRLESEARQKFGISFADTKAAQADQLIRPWLRSWMSDHPPSDPHEYFINIANSDIRTATHNSQQWAEAEVARGLHAPDMDVYWYPIDPLLHSEEGHALKRRSN